MPAAMMSVIAQHSITSRPTQAGISCVAAAQPLAVRLQAPTNGNVVKDLLSLDDDNDTPKASAVAPSSFAEDLLGGLGADSNGHAAGPAASGAAATDLLSLLDDSASSQPPPGAGPGAAAPPAQNALVCASSRHIIGTHTFCIYKSNGTSCFGTA